MIPALIVSPLALYLIGLLWWRFGNAERRKRLDMAAGCWCGSCGDGHGEVR